MGEHGGTVSSRSCRCSPTWRFPRGLEDYSVCCHFCYTVIYAHFLSSSALSEVLNSPLPYDDILSLRDRMWDISPTLVRYDVAERTSPEVAVAGLQIIAANTASAKVSGKPFLKPISNFYQTDPISRALVYLFIDFYTQAHALLVDLSLWHNVHALLSRGRTMGSVRRAQKQHMRDRCILIVGVVVAISSIDLRRARLLLSRQQARQVFPLCVTVFGIY